MEMLKVTDEAVLLSASLNFESTSTIEPWAYVCSTLMIIVIDCFLLLMTWRRSMVFVVAAERAVMRVERSWLLELMITTPNFGSTCRFPKIVMTSIYIKVVVKRPKLRHPSIDRATLKHSGLRRRSQTLPNWLSNLIEIVCNVIKHKFLSSHDSLIGGRSRILLGLSSTWNMIVRIHLSLRAVMSMMNMRRHPSMLLLRTIMMVVEMMNMWRDLLTCLVLLLR